MLAGVPASPLQSPKPRLTRQDWSTWLVGLFCLLLSLSNAWAAGQHPLLVRSWAPGPDPRQRSVLALMQSRDGYLWIGTGAGLIRFDGVGFTRFTTASTAGMEADRMSFGALWEDATGVIWAGTEFHGVVRNDHGAFNTLTTKNGLPDSRVLRIDGDETGAVWIYTLTGVSRWREGKLEQPHPEQETSGTLRFIPFSYKRPIDFAKTGLWRRRGAAIERFAYGRWTSFPTPPEEAKPFEEDIETIVEDSQHRVWYSLLSQPGRAYCVVAGGLRHFDGVPAHTFVSYQDRDGFLWLTDHGAHTARWKEGHLYPLPELHSPFLLHALEASNGSIWAGTAGTDLFQFRQRRFDLIPTAGSPEFAPVLFRQHDGAVWAGGLDLQRLSSLPSGPVATPVVAANKPKTWIQMTALSETPGGDVLVGSRAPAGIQQLHASAYKAYMPGNAAEGTVQAMLLDTAGTQWIGTTAGLYSMKASGNSRPERLLTGSVRCLAEAADGTIWAGTGTGPFHAIHGAAVPVKAEQPWAFGAIVAMRVGANGELWMATQEHGLVRFDGHAFLALTSGDGLPTDNLYNLQFDLSGNLWMGSDLGLIRIRGESLTRHLANAGNRLQTSLLNDADGLPASSLDPLGNQGSLMLPNGLLWFSTEIGIAQFDPQELFTDPPAAHAVIEEHTMDGAALQQGSIVLHPGQSNLEIHYSALRSDNPEQLIFRYRLQGYDAHWIDAGRRRIAYYSHLPPGAYTFEVQTAATDGAAWDTASATTAVRVLTPFYRTGWMKLILAVVCGLALAYALLRRRRLTSREQERRQAFTHQLILTQETERKRIAHELHDSVGQHLVLIRTLAMLPHKESGTGINPLQTIAQQAATAIKEVETISYDLRPYQLDRLGLTKALLSSVESFKQTSDSILVECHIEDVDDFLPKDKSINLYRIVQEALSNILKHAGATTVRISITRLPKCLRLIIADDGHGFETENADRTRSSLGLVGIRERAEALGGRATITSALGLGTTVTVEVPST